MSRDPQWEALFGQLQHPDSALAAVRELVDRVKAAENHLDDPTAVFALVAARLHDFLGLLFHPDDAEIQGCMISVIRRVGMDPRAIAALGAYRESCSEGDLNLFAEALGEATQFSDAIEATLLELLELGTEPGSPGWIVAPGLLRSHRASTAAALRRAEQRGNPRAGYCAAQIERRCS